MGYNFKWVRSCLKERVRFVTVNGSLSSPLSVFSAVPQESVLWPVLFLAYLNDISEIINPKITVRLFADDCLIYTRI